MHQDPSRPGWQNQPPSPGAATPQAFGVPLPAQPQAHGGFGQRAHSHASGIACPRCGIPSESVKSYTMMSFLIFIFIGAWWRTKRVVACASCMRSELLTSTLINVFTANVLSPIVLIWHGVLLAMTFQEGHSADVAKHIY